MAVAISQTWGKANPGYDAGYHTGIDYAVGAGTKIAAVGDGKVVESGFNNSYGNYIKILHPGGLYTFYAHLSSRNYAKGSTVKAGQVIGLSGNTGNSTGAHLHFEVRTGSGTYNENVDPMKYFSPLARGVISGQGGTTQKEPMPAYRSAAAPVGTYKTAEQAASKSTSTSGGKSTNTTTYSSSGGGSAKGGAVAEKPLTKQDFGFSSAFLAANPTINNLVEDAIKNGWTNAQLQGRVIDSDWYRARTKAQRDYDMAVTSDPASIAESERKMLEELTRLAKVMGVNSTGLETEAKNAVRNGLTADDYIGFLSVRANYSEEQVGRAGIAQQKILEYGDAYGVTTGPDEVNRIMRESLSAGNNWETVLTGYEDHFRERAKSLYSGVAKQIDEGATVKDILNPYLSRAADMLGTPVEQMSTSNGQWNRAITGEVPMTLQEWEKQVRTDSTYRWDKGPQALEWARGVGDEFMKAFGART